MCGRLSAYTHAREPMPHQLVSLQGEGKGQWRRECGKGQGRHCPAGAQQGAGWSNRSFRGHGEVGWLPPLHMTWKGMGVGHVPLDLRGAGQTAAAGQGQGCTGLFLVGKHWEGELGGGGLQLPHCSPSQCHCHPPLAQPPARKSLEPPQPQRTAAVCPAPHRPDIMHPLCFPRCM